MRLSRRTVLGSGAGIAAGLTAGLSGCASPTPQPAVRTPRPKRHRYGHHSQQYGDLYLPRSSGSRGTVVVIHGGFWQAGYALDLGAAISADLAERGWVAWNIEYRRIRGGGGWPHTFADVAGAVDHLAELGVGTDQVVTLGHSAGGQLAAWAASRRGHDLPGDPPRVTVTATVPQAGVVDLATAADTGLGGTAVLDLVGGRPSRLPARYRKADPIQRVPLGVPIRCVHGASDDTVPISQSKAFVRAARAAGDDAELIEVPGDHFSLIDPDTPAWRRTVQVLGDLTS